MDYYTTSCLIVIMRHCGFDVMFFLLYLHGQVLLTRFSKVCRTLDVEDVEALMKLRRLRIESGSGLLGFECC
jgi:hypothetical protein